MASPVSVNVTKAGLAEVVIDNPPVNATSVAVREGLWDAIEAAEKAGATHGLISCKGRTFVAGGDVTEFGKPPEEPHLPDVFDRLEASPVIWGCALHGTVLGGGFELAMSCDVRVADPACRFGLPEVLLGLVPGAGGTQRCPRLLGVEMALDLTTTGRMASAAEIQKAGGLDAIAQGDLLSLAKETLLAVDEKPVPVSARSVSAPATGFFETARDTVARKAKGASAPARNIDAIEWSVNLPFEVALKKERALFMELRDGDQSKALRHAFFAERAVAKPAAIKDVTARPVSHISVVGGGVMGAGIAASALLAGYNVNMVERDEEAANAGHERVAGILEGSLKRGKITEDTKQQMLGQFTSDADYGSCANADLAIEAVFEDLSVKQAVFRQLGDVMPTDALIATNTSYLDPAAIAEGVDNPARVMGLHFFSPAHVMKLVEVVRTDHTNSESLATGFAVAKRLGKIAVLSGVCDGFIGNRMLAAYRRQADYLVADGALPHEIDAAMRAFGMPMGPYELQDLTGLQISWANRKRQAVTRDPNERYVTIADQLCEMDRLGQRSGKGWYRYEAGNREPQIDDAVVDLIKAYSKDEGISRQAFGAKDIQDRLIAVLINEGARIVEEGIAERDLDVDMVKIHGYGFPRWRGGPMHYGERLGVERIRETLLDVTAQSPESWKIADRFR